MAKSKKASQLLEWYQREKPTFDSLARTAESILQNLINKARIPVVSISSRVKASGSLIEKQKRKRYKNPSEEITDLVGLRVITYTEDEAVKVCEIVKSAFSIDAARSVDKATELDVDQIGYRSHHYVCDLGAQRVALPEFEVFARRPFEVQVRTVLQHAWAEVEHDRNYKFSGVLPSELKRRLYLISGLLEIGDRELNSLSRDIEKYSKDVKAKAEAGDLSDELTSVTLMAMMPRLTAALTDCSFSADAAHHFVTIVVKECISFGVTTTNQLSAMVTPKFIAAMNKKTQSNNTVGFVRDAMMWTDLRRYFTDAWQEHWTSSTPDLKDFLSERYPADEVMSVLNENNITLDDVYPDENSDSDEFDHG